MRGEQTNFRQTAISIANPSYPDPYGGRDPLSLGSLAQNISIVDNDLQNQRSMAISGGLSQGINSTLAAHADVVYNHITGVPQATRAA